VDSQTTQGTQHEPSTAEVLDGLNDLLKLNHDAVAAYDIAIERLEDPDHASQISGFRADHQRHIAELNDQITRRGGTPENRPHRTAPLKEGLQKVGSLGGDRGTLIAWRINELQVRTKYDSYASKAGTWPDDLKPMIDRQALDEERHYQWVVDLLQRLGIGPDDELETRIATRMREASAQLDAAANRARERVGDAASAAKNRIASSLDATGDRIETMEQERQLQGRAADITDRAARGMHSSASYLRENDLDSARRDLERVAREYPFRTVATCFIFGFVVGRILR
jgi:rubrerythrin